MVDVVTTAPGRRRFSDDELLDAALELFHAHGYHAVQMTELARHAGTTKPTLYARLGSKEQIYIRVLKREAELLQHALYEEYERAVREPLQDVIAIAMLAFFGFAARRRAGFDLLFRSEPGGPGHGIGERAMDEVIDHVTRLVDDYIVRTGHRPGTRTPLLAAAGVGVARQVCQYALENGHDLTAAGALATAFTEAGMRRFDERALLELDVRRPS
jgi:AcrR family transcriptional regulator